MPGTTPSNVAYMKDFRAPVTLKREGPREPSLSNEQILKLLKEVEEGCHAIDNVIAIAEENLVSMKEKLVQIRLRYEQLRKDTE